MELVAVPVVDMAAAGTVAAGIAEAVASWVAVTSYFTSISLHRGRTH
jgi:hypothetical protein